MGSFQTLELIETFINYQESIKRCICIIYDPHRTKTGSLKVSPLTDTLVRVHPLIACIRKSTKAQIIVKQSWPLHGKQIFCLPNVIFKAFSNYSSLQFTFKVHWKYAAKTVMQGQGCCEGAVVLLHRHS